MSTNHPRPARVPSPPPRSPSPIPRPFPQASFVSSDFAIYATSSRPCPYPVQAASLEVQGNGNVRSTQSSPLVQRAALAVPAVAFLTEVKSESDVDDDVCSSLQFVLFKWLIGAGRRTRLSRRPRMFSGRSRSRRSRLFLQLVSHITMKRKK